MTGPRYKKDHVDISVIRKAQMSRWHVFMGEFREVLWAGVYIPEYQKGHHMLVLFYFTYIMDAFDVYKTYFIVYCFFLVFRMIGLLYCTLVLNFIYIYMYVLKKY